MPRLVTSSAFSTKSRQPDWGSRQRSKNPVQPGKSEKKYSRFYKRQFCDCHWAGSFWRLQGQFSSNLIGFAAHVTQGDVCVEHGGFDGAGDVAAFLFVMR